MGMKKIIGYLRLQLKEDFHITYYTAVFLFLALCMIINYTFDFNDSYIDTIPGINRIAANILFFSVAYFIPVAALRIIKKQPPLLTKDFYIKALFGLGLLGLDSGFPYLQEWLSSLPLETQFWAYKVSINLISVFTVLIPLAVFHAAFEKKKSRLYGLGATRFDWSPYLVMLLIMLPVLAGASAFEGFQRQYPMYKSTNAHTYLQVPEYVTVLVYELAYGMDFITVELLFRGFFIVGMISIMGRAAIVPMVSVYCFLHFGKPAGEAISSIFGGYLLGVIAYETKSIWGGVAIHVGIAWMMELLAYLQKDIL